MKPKTRRGIVAALISIGLLLWVAAPIVAVVALTRASADTVVQERRAVYVAPAPNDGEVSRAVTVELRWDSSKPLLAPAWSGLVQKVEIAPGSKLEEGTPIAVVGGISRTASVTPVPFERALHRGDNGSDVEMLNTVLRARGYSAGEGDQFTSATNTGVRQLASSIAVPGGDRVEEFDPSWLVFLPEPAVVESVELRVAALAPSQGSEFVTLAPSLMEAVLGEGSASQREPATEEDAAPDSRPLVPTAVATDEETLWVGSTEVPLDPDSLDRVAADFLPAFALLVQSRSASTPASLRLAPTSGQWVLPAAAVVTDGEDVCVHVDGDAGGNSVVLVVVIGVNDGVAVVTGELHDKDRVLVSGAGRDATCE